MNDQKIKTCYRTCPRYEFDSVKELDDSILGLCKDLTVNGNVMVSILTAKHTYEGFCKMLADYLSDESSDKVENAPIYMGWAFKSQSFEEISDGIRRNVAKGAKLVILDRCVDDVSRYAELAAELNVSMIALDIKNNN